MLLMGLRCFNNVYAGVECKSPSCADAVDILVYTDKKLSSHRRHESHQFEIKSANGNSPPSPYAMKFHTGAGCGTILKAAWKRPLIYKVPMYRKQAEIEKILPLRDNIHLVYSMMG